MANCCRTFPALALLRAASSPLRAQLCGGCHQRHHRVSTSAPTRACHQWSLVHEAPPPTCPLLVRVLSSQSYEGRTSRIVYLLVFLLVRLLVLALVHPAILLVSACQPPYWSHPQAHRHEGVSTADQVVDRVPSHHVQHVPQTSRAFAYRAWIEGIWSSSGTHYSHCAVDIVSLPWRTLSMSLSGRQQ